MTFLKNYITYPAELQIKKMSAIQRAALLYYYKSKLSPLFINVSGNTDIIMMKDFDKWRYKGAKNQIKNQLDNTKAKQGQRESHLKEFKKVLASKSKFIN